MNFSSFKWTGFWNPTILSDRFLRPTQPPKSFRWKDWETCMENWTTPNEGNAGSVLKEMLCNQKIFMEIVM